MVTSSMCMACMDPIGRDIGNSPITIAETKKVKNNLAIADFSNWVKKIVIQFKMFR
jgi:hypothetical protein